MFNSVKETGSHSRMAIQWIVSLAVSVLCCALLFVVFASHLPDIQGNTELALVRLAILQERQNQLISELDMMRRSGMAQANVATIGIPTNSSSSSPSAADSNSASSALVEPAAASSVPMPAAPPVKSSAPATP
ncbi:MAG: hypothetical protein HGA90_00710 [Alphaproteobacteria bacterium]|nr:hypothetical protein [Alphaproteobacteria bacterium]